MGHGFKIAFRGFARADVLNYIDELHRTAHEEQEALRAENQRLQEMVAELHKKTVNAEETEQQREALAAVQAACDVAQTRVEELTAALASAEAERDALKGELAAREAAVGEMEALKEREAELARELTETKQAVAGLWQEKDAAEQKIAAVLNFADSLQQQVLELKRKLGENPPAQVAEEPAQEEPATEEPEEAKAEEAEETPASKPMESWLF